MQANSVLLILMQQVLIVENDTALAESLKTVLAQLEVVLHHTSTLEQTFSLLEKAKFDIVILDRLLKDGDGLEVAEYLHQVSYPTQIIIISTMGKTSQRLNGLKQGADLYLAKPFNKKELLLMVKKALNAAKIKPNNKLSLGQLSFSKKTGLVSTPDFNRRLRKKEAEILHFLMVRKNQTVTREQIIAGVWGSSLKIPTYSTIDAYIRKIRVTLGEYANHIKTIRGFGYSAVDWVCWRLELLVKAEPSPPPWCRL